MDVICSESCPEENRLKDTTTSCFSCGVLVHLKCHGIGLKTTEWFCPNSQVQFICKQCHNASPRRKQTSERKTTKSTTSISSTPSNSQIAPIFNSSALSSNTVATNILSILTIVKRCDKKLDKLEKILKQHLDISQNVKKMNEDMNKIDTNIQATIKSSSDLASKSLDTAVSTISGKIESVLKPTFAETLSANTISNHNNNNNLCVDQTGTPLSTINTQKNPRLRTAAGGCRVNFDGTPFPSPQTSQSTDFERMIWIGRINNTVTTDIMEKYIADHFNLPETAKVIVKCLINKNITDISTVPSLSYKINVDSEETFNKLIDPQLWPSQCRLREFFNRPRTASLNDFLPNQLQSNNQTQTSAEIMESDQQ